MSMRHHKNIPKNILPARRNFNRKSFFVDGFVDKFVDYWLWNRLRLSYHLLLQKYLRPIHFSCNFRLELWFFIWPNRLVITFTCNGLVFCYCFSWAESWTRSLRNFFTLTLHATYITFVSWFLRRVRKLFWLFILFINYIRTMIRFLGLLLFIFT